jgi:hypothetical protein
MTFDSYQEYKGWAETATAEQRRAYLAALPDADLETLMADAEDERLMADKCYESFLDDVGGGCPSDVDEADQ